MQPNAYRLGSELLCENSEVYKNPRESLNWPVTCSLAFQWTIRISKLYRSRGRKRQSAKYADAQTNLILAYGVKCGKGSFRLEYQRGVVCLDCFDAFASER